MTTSTPSPDNVTKKMQRCIDRWDACGDGKALFLRCYRMMTGNVIAAVQQRDFNDPEWVDRLLNHFADYYFVSLEVYEANPAGAPAVWQLAHSAANNPNLSAVQKLLVGVNAHINYDLAFTLVDLLRQEWAGLSDAQRTLRYEDHCRINNVIAETIDTVQDDILEPAMPVMKLVDDLMGGADELMISRLIAGWRDNVWQYAVRMLATDDLQQLAALAKQVEADALETGRLICAQSPA
jgi:hypothetical protein